MRRKLSVALAAVLLITVGLPRRLTLEGQADINETMLIDSPESDQEEDESAIESAEEAVTIGKSGEEEPAAESAVGLEDESEAVTPEDTQKSIAGFTAFSTNEAVVTNYSELKSALANDNGITTVYFGDNITMQAGIKINAKKTNVIIDGFNPLDPAQAQPYTLTELDSSSFNDTIYIDAEGTSTLLIRDLAIIGKNYYGPFSIYDSSSLAGITLTYERVDYNGPQLGYHRKGAVYIKDCTVRIHGGNGTKCASNEFSEAKYLTFEGANRIDTATSAHSIFWIPSGGSFQIADDSSLIVTSPDTSATYGVFYADGSSNKVAITIGNRAVFDATVSGTVAPDNYVTLSSFTVREGGAFYLKITKTASSTALKMGGALTVEKDAKFVISGYSSASYAILVQESGDITVGKNATFQITANNAYTTLNLVGSALICNDPASVLLYNANRNILASTSAGRVYVNAQQVNYRNALSPGGLDNPPLYRWDKADQTNFVLDGALATGASGNFSSISSNYNAGDPPGVAPSATTFSMVNARVLSFGRLELIVSEPTTRSTSISGVAAPGATVRASFTQQGIDYTFPEVAADSEGVFRVPIDVALDTSTTITVKSNWQYLTSTAEAVVVGDNGVFELFVPDVLEFFSSELTSSAKTIKRLNSDWKIVVSDTRGAGSGWSIYARLGREMTPGLSSLPVLEGALVFADDSGNTTVMNTDADTLISKHTALDDEEIIPVAWDADKGVLLVVKPGAAFAGVIYTASISWTLINGV